MLDGSSIYSVDDVK